MRLIDAEEFKKQIAGMAIVNNYPADKANKMCELIDCQPTAYDVDKVIKQLEDFAGNNICALRKNCPGDCGCEHCGAIGALEIVKAEKKGE